jgi:hypothetical protein
MIAVPRWIRQSAEQFARPGVVAFRPPQPWPVVTLALLRMRRVSRSALILCASLAACADLSTRPERVPSSLVLEPAILTVTEGDPVEVGITVLDQHGSPFESLPSWATHHWSVSDATAVGLEGSGLTAVGPGQSIATAELAGLRKDALVRVNPRQLRLVVAEVGLRQAGNPSAQLVANVNAELRVLLTADRPNFFRPRVRATFHRDGAVVGILEMQRSRESIPLSREDAGQQEAWTSNVPAAFIAPGTSLVVEADPDLTIPRAPGSEDRYPAAGARSLEITDLVGLEIRGAYLVQSTQRLDGTVPLVAGRDALLRVFLVADMPNHAAPVVRATFHRGGVVVHAANIPSTSSSIATDLHEDVLAGSWNVVVPGSVVQPGLSMVLEVDAGSALALRPGSRLRHPAQGTLALDVRRVPPLWMRMVPIHQSPEGTTGDIRPDNIAGYMQALVSMFPIQEYDVDLRAPFTTSHSARTAAGWSSILGELRALRTVEGSGRYYYGVLRAPSGTPYGGLGYIGLPVAIGHDQASGGPGTFAHELGHNFGIGHAPCGNPSYVESGYPHAGGRIGTFGYDMVNRSLKSPSATFDLMSYCGPAWISDWTFLRSFSFRDAADWTRGPAAPGATEPTLLVWGGARDGRLILEPAFELVTRPLLPRGPGPYRVRGYDQAGTVLFSHAFAVEEIAHAPGASSFAFALPARAVRPDRLARIELIGPEGSTSRSTRGDAPAGRRPRVTSRATARGVGLTWDAGANPMALVRDARTGEVIAFARGGRVDLETGGRPLEILVSDGVRTSPAEIERQ